jgi:DNA polymerase elongation subunit (family B)
VSNYIWLFGVSQHLDTKETISVAFRIQDFCPYFYIRLREGENTLRWKQQFETRCAKADSKPIRLTPDDKQDGIPSNRFDIHRITFEYLRPLIGFHPPEHGDVWYVAKIWCVNQHSRSRLVSYLKGWQKEEPEVASQLIVGPLLHDHLTPAQQFITEMLRIPPITIMDPARFSDRSVPHRFSVCRWYHVHRVSPLPPKDKATSVQLEARIRMLDMVTALDHDPQFRTPNSRIVALDCETIGHGFRFANASNQEDTLGCLCCALVVHNESDPLLGVWFCLGSTLHAGRYEVAGTPVFILCFSTEKELLIAFLDWWKRVDPDGYCSWNGEKYDFPFLLERLKLHGLSTGLGRFPKEELKSPWVILQEVGFWSRKGKISGSQGARPPSIRQSGRISLDGLPWYPRFAKVENYQLKTVTKEFVKKKAPSLPIPDPRDPPPPPTSHPLGDVQGATQDTVEPDTKEWIETILLNPKRHGKIDLEYHKIGPYAVVSSLHRYALAYYCYFDAIYAWKCLRDPHFVDFIYQIRFHTAVDAHAAQELGQQILVYYRLLFHVQAGHYALNGNEWDELRPEKYSGGFCAQPIAGQHICVIIADYNSLYPSCIRAYQLSYDTLCTHPEMLQLAKKLGYDIIESECDQRIYRWVQMKDPNNTLLADFFKEFFDSRKQHKKLLAEAKEKKDHLGIVFHGCAEKGIKLIMNATYGFEGSATLENTGESENMGGRKSSYWPLSGFFPIALVTTFFGRSNIQKVFSLMSQTKEIIGIQGDTDSLFWKWLRSFYQQMASEFQQEWNEIRAKFLAQGEKDEKYQLLRKEMKWLDRRMLTRVYDVAEAKRKDVTQGSLLTLEIETIFWTLHSLHAKKKYCGWSFLKTNEEDRLPNGEVVYRFEEKLKVKGLESERRDISPFVKKVVATLIEMLVKPTQEDQEFGFVGFLLHPDHDYLRERKKKMLNDIATYLHRVTCQIASGSVPIEELAVGKTLKNEYKKEVAHSFVARRMNERGEKLEVGSKIFIVKVKLKRVKDIFQFEEMEYVKAHQIPIDYGYYLDTILIPILERMLLIPNMMTKQDLRWICNDAHQLLPVTMKEARNIESYFTRS